MSETDKKRILVIPDVHGRDFWKRPVAETPCDKIIFLGDYFDPYDDEYITSEEALQNFDEVMKLKQQNPEKVVLLWGNHDLHYASELFRQLACGSRYDAILAPVFASSLLAHATDFHLAHEEKIGETRYLFTHAGVTSMWYELHRDIIQELTADNLDCLLKTQKGTIALSEVGASRRGRDSFGSMMWADVDEMSCSDSFPGIYQIFGHTQNRRGPVITDYYACLDCRRAFLLDNNGLKKV